MTDEYVDSREACKILKIKPQTLYAYVSRGFIRTVGSRGQGILYARSDLAGAVARSRARLGHGAVAAGALKWGEPVLESAITFVGEDDIFYRGFPLKRLMQNHISFERVAELMWSGQLPPDELQWPHSEKIHLEAPFDFKHSNYAAMSLLLSQRALASGPKQSQTLSDTLAEARSILCHMAGVTKPATSIASALAFQLLPSKKMALGRSLIDAALVAATDFELSASTFAARIAASTGAPLIACLQAGLAAFSGHVHGAQVDAVECLLDEVGNTPRFESILKFHLGTGAQLPGFGQKLFPGGDPRAAALIAMLKDAELVGEALSPPGKMAEWNAFVLKKTGLKPNIELALVMLARRLKLPSGSAFSLFAMGRMAGWISHVIEQRQQGHVLRPRAKYTGR